MTTWQDDVRRRLTLGTPDPAPHTPPATAPAQPDVPPWRTFHGRPAQLDLDAYRTASTRTGTRSLALLRALIGHDPLADRVAAAGDRLGTNIVTGRRIVVLGAAGGAGTTTLTTQLARTYSTYRPDRTLVTAGAADHGSLAARLGLEAHATEATVADALADIVFATSCGLARILPLDDGLAVLAGHDGDPHTLRRTIVRLASAIAVSLTDAGRDLDHPTLHDAHAVVVTTPRTLDGTVAATSLADTVRHLYPHAAVVVATVDTGTQSTLQPAEQLALLTARGETVTPIPHDRHLAGGARIDLARLSERARLATLEAAGSIIAAAAPPYPASRLSHG